MPIGTEKEQGKKQKGFFLIGKSQNINSFFVFTKRLISYLSRNQQEKFMISVFTV
jgi:hypothetical protein